MQSRQWGKLGCRGNLSRLAQKEHVDFALGRRDLSKKLMAYAERNIALILNLCRNSAR